MIRVSTLLGWDDLTFCMFQEKCGCQYLQECMSKYPELVDKMILDQRFWQVWNDTWEYRDNVYLESIEFSVYLGIEEDYKMFHSPNMLKIMLPIKSFLRVYNLKTGIQ